MCFEDMVSISYFMKYSSLVMFTSSRVVLSSHFGSGSSFASAESSTVMCFCSIIYSILNFLKYLYVVITA